MHTCLSLSPPPLCLPQTIQVDDLRAATGIWDPETNTIPFLNVSSLVELSRNGDVSILTTT